MIALRRPELPERVGCVEMRAVSVIQGNVRRSLALRTLDWRMADMPKGPVVSGARCSRVSTERDRSRADSDSVGLIECHADIPTFERSRRRCANSVVAVAGLRSQPFGSATWW